MNFHELKLAADDAPAPCSECNKCFRDLTVLAIGTAVEVRLCRVDLERLTAFFIFRRPRRRPLNPRLRDALEFLQEARDAVPELALRAHIGRYATNTLESLRARGFATLSDDGAWFRISPAGRVALKALSGGARHG